MYCLYSTNHQPTHRRFTSHPDPRSFHNSNIILDLPPSESHKHKKGNNRNRMPRRSLFSLPTGRRLTRMVMLLTVLHASAAGTTSATSDGCRSEDSDRVAAVARVLGHSSCSDEEEGSSFDSQSAPLERHCSCVSSADGRSHTVACSEGTQVLCSPHHPYMCGTHSASLTFLDDESSPPETRESTVTAADYQWTYDGRTRSETLRYREDHDGTCSLDILQNADGPAAVVHRCSCHLTICRDGFVHPTIDCSSYESGAVYDGCEEDGASPPGSLLEGLVLGWARFPCHSQVDRSLQYYDNAPTPTYNYYAPTPTYNYSAPTPTYNYYAPTPTYTSSRSTSKSNGGAIAGSVTGVLLAGLVAGLYVWHRHRKQVAEASAADANGEGDSPEAHQSCWTPENLESCASVFKHVLELFEAISKWCCPTDESRSGVAAHEGAASATGGTDDKAVIGSEEDDEPTTNPSDSVDWAPSSSPEVFVVNGAMVQPSHTQEYVDESGVRVVEEVYYQ